MTSPSALAVTVDITPDRPLPLFGYHQRREDYRDISRGLEANILGISGPGSPPLLLVSVDALYGGAITPRLRKRLNLDPDQLVVLGSHTHFAPGIDPGIPGLGHTDPDYVDEVVEKVATAVEAAHQEADPTVGYASALTQGLFVNRRRPTLGVGLPIPRIGRILAAPHIRGGVDARVRVATVEVAGRVVALLWGASCHPVASPDPLSVSPCFPGEIRARLRDALGLDVPVVFCQGFSGDVRPAAHTRRVPTGARALLQYVLAGGRRFAQQSKIEYAEWCDGLTAVVLRAVRALASSPREAVLGSVVRVAPSRPTGWRRAARVSRIRLSSGVSIIAVNAEVGHERVVDLEQAFAEATIPAGCCDEVIGYWPSDAMVREGGYEGGDAARFFPQLDWNSVQGPDALWWELLQEATLTSEEPAVRRGSP